MANSKSIFFVGLILAASGVLSPPIALLIGIAYGFTFKHPYLLDSRNLSRFLLQAAVVALGFDLEKFQNKNPPTPKASTTINATTAPITIPTLLFEAGATTDGCGTSGAVAFGVWPNLVAAQRLRCF